MNKNNEQESQLNASSVRENSVGWMIKTLATRLDQEMNSRLMEHDISLGQFAILMTLLQGDSITQAEIGKKISMPGYATTRNLDALEENGLLERQQSKQSRRSHSIVLTAKAKKLAPELFKIVKIVNEGVLSPLSKPDVEQLKIMLRSMIYK